MPNPRTAPGTNPCAAVLFTRPKGMAQETTNLPTGPRALSRWLAKTDAPELKRLALRKSSHNAEIYYAQLLDGTGAYLKLYTRPHRAQLVAQAVAEISRVRSHMTGSSLTVARAIWSDESIGALMLEEVPGTQVSKLMEDAAWCRTGLPRIADWLAAYIGPTLESGLFNAPYWVERAGKADRGALPVSDAALYSRALHRQQGRLAALRGAEAAKALCPSDFAPHNLLADGLDLHGIDVERKNREPAARAMARFAVLANPRLGVAGPGRFGLKSGLLEAFDVALPRPNEPAGLMPFLVLDCLMDRLIRRHDTTRGPDIRAAITAHLSETAA